MTTIQHKDRLVKIITETFPKMSIELASYIASALVDGNQLYNSGSDLVDRAELTNDVLDILKMATK